MNYIFDMGNVLITYEPNKVIDKYAKKEHRDILRNAIFEDGDWAKKDAGEYTVDGYKDILLNKLTDDLKQEAITIYEHWYECLEPIDNAYEYVANLKKQGHKLYLLSNASADFFEYSKGFKVFELFDGIVISAIEGVTKPNKRIYEILLKRYDLNPKECFFIDDMPINVQGAIECGINARTFYGDFDMFDTLYASDLDGTLLDNNVKVSNNTVEQLGIMIDKGLQFTIATARSKNSTIQVLNGLEIKLPIVVYNGTMLIENYSEYKADILYAASFTNKQRAKIKAAIKKHKLSVFVYSFCEGKEKVRWKDEKVNEAMRYHLSKKVNDPRFLKADNDEELYSDETYYYTYMGSYEEGKALYDELCDDEELTVLLQKEKYKKGGEPEYWCEIMPYRAQKLLTLQKLMELNNYKRLVVFGDGLNDINMMKKADEAYAMANSFDEVISYIGNRNDKLSGIIDSNEKDGVIQKLKTYSWYIKSRLMAMKEPEYAQFTKKLTPNARNVLGVRLPALRGLAKEIAKLHDVRDYLDNGQMYYYEEIMLKGMVIGAAKLEEKEYFKYIKSFVPYIYNWSICDSFSAGLKKIKKYKEYAWRICKEYAASNKEYEARFALVVMINYFIEEKYLDDIIKMCENVKAKGYYADMAVAWTLAEVFSRYNEFAVPFYKRDKLPDFIHNKSIQKICESNKVKTEFKETVRALKRKKAD